MKERFEDVRQAALSVALKVNRNSSPFHLTVISNEHVTHRFAPHQYEHYCYISAQAGSNDRFINVPGYRAFAAITLQYCVERDEYVVIRDARPIKKGYGCEQVLINQNTLSEDFEAIVAQFMQDITKPDYTIN